MDSEDDSDGYKRPSVLPVANFTNFDPSKPPASGEEYLRRVQLEAQKCPEVAVANLDIESFRIQQTETIPNNNQFSSTKPELRLSVEKQHEIIAYFISVRMRVSTLRSKVPGNGSVQGKVPPINDHQAWRSYIIDNGRDTSGSEEIMERSCLPHLSLLLKFDQIDHHKLLKYLLRWTVDDGFDETIGLWIFSILVCIEKPIHSEIYATFRDISHIISKLRSEEDLNVKNIKSINILICIIGRYFDQKDMIDE